MMPLPAACTAGRANPARTEGKAAAEALRKPRREVPSPVLLLFFMESLSIVISPV
jgi:hypothetical protein